MSHTRATDDHQAQAHGDRVVPHYGVSSIPVAGHQYSVSQTFQGTGSRKAWRALSQRDTYTTSASETQRVENMLAVPDDEHGELAMDISPIAPRFPGLELAAAPRARHTRGYTT